MKVGDDPSYIFYIGTNKGVYRAEIDSLVDTAAVKAELIGLDGIDIVELKISHQRLYASTTTGDVLSAELYLLTGDR